MAIDEINRKKKLRSGIVFKYDKVERAVLNLNYSGIKFLGINEQEDISKIDVFKRLHKGDLLKIMEKISIKVIDISNHYCSIRVKNSLNNWETFFVKFSFTDDNNQIIEGIAHTIDSNIINSELLMNNFVEINENESGGKEKIILQDVLKLLTQREEEIFYQICDGYKNKEIAVNLNISHHTVKTHRKRIIKKLKVNNSMELHKFIKKV